MRVLLVLALAACGDGPGKTTIRGEATLETFTDRMCKCTDGDCAQGVIRDFARWSKTIKKPRTDAAPLMERYNACLTAAIRNSR